MGLLRDGQLKANIIKGSGGLGWKAFQRNQNQNHAGAGGNSASVERTEIEERIFQNQREL